MAFTRLGLIRALAIAALLGGAGVAQAQPYPAPADGYDAPPDLEIRPGPRPFLSGVITPEEFWSNDYQSGELFKSLIAPDQLNETRYRRRICRAHPEACGF